MSRRITAAPPVGLVPSEADPREAHLFAVLADQARARSGWELVATAAGAALDALVLNQRLGMWWVSAVFVAISAYGWWGVCDRVMEDLSALTTPARVLDHARRLLDVGRGLTAAVGVLSVLGALGGFMAAMVRGWIS